MPVSSGGGSHSGGHRSGGSSHSTSHSSSRGSTRSTSHGYAHGGSTSGPISGKPYGNARPYVFMRNGKREVFWQSGERSEPSKFGVFAILMLIAAFFLPFVIVLWSFGVSVPKRIDPASYDSRIVIEDRADLIADTAPVESSFADFREKTGVTPSLVVVDEESWVGFYQDCETFAYHEYLRLFDDEKHWLIVVSYPAADEVTGLIDWKWQGMIGEDTPETIDLEARWKFGELLQRRLLRADPEEVGEAVAKAFDELGETVMDVKFTFPAAIVIACILFGVYVLLAVLILRSHARRKRFAEAQPAAPGVCPYCDCKVSESDVTCSHCGAPVKP
ncbi:MAG: zinc ribbon domain-containing protein [Clostridia bacterium]|nr:zinc ribbon domain-containing protein [Clostridia bacterium]